MSKRSLKIIAVASAIVFTLLIETKTTWGLGWNDLNEEDQLYVMLFHARSHKKALPYNSYMSSHGNLKGLKQRTENDLFYKCSKNEDAVFGITKKDLIIECTNCNICGEKIAKTTRKIQKLDFLQGIRDAISAQSVLLNTKFVEMEQRLQSIDFTISNAGIQIPKEVEEE